MSTFQPTTEQTDILAAILDPSLTNIKIRAFAGTGKTSTLVWIASQLAEQRPDWRGLYLAFNKGVATEAKNKFGNNVSCLTNNGLAYRFFNHNSNFQLDLGNANRNFRPATFDEDFPSIRLNNWAKSDLVLRLLEEFCNTDYLEIDTDFLNTTFHKKLDLRAKYGVLRSQGLDYGRIIATLKGIFGLVFSGQVPATHNIYFKLYQGLLSKKSITPSQFDFIFLDEAQDTNPATQSIFQSLSSPKKIIVGDIHQKIYGFRGTTNFVESWISDAELSLSTTFRTPDYVGNYANRILKNFKGEKLDFRTFHKLTTSDHKTTTLISRSNAKIIWKIKEFLDKKNSLDTKDGAVLDLNFDPFNPTIHPRPVLATSNPKNLTTNSDETKKVSTTKFLIYNNEIDYVFQGVENIYYLQKSYLEPTKKAHWQNKIKGETSYIKRFGNLEELTEYGKVDYEIMRCLKLIEKLGDQIFECKKLATDQELSDGDQPDFILITAHKSKGLEWEKVEIQDDFGAWSWDENERGLCNIFTSYINDKTSYLKTLQKNLSVESLEKFFEDLLGSPQILGFTEELNLFYIAITRTKRELAFDKKSKNHRYFIEPDQDQIDPMNMFKFYFWKPNFEYTPKQPKETLLTIVQKTHKNLSNIYSDLPKNATPKNKTKLKIILAEIKELEVTIAQNGEYENLNANANKFLELQQTIEETAKLLKFSISFDQYNLLILLSQNPIFFKFNDLPKLEIYVKNNQLTLVLFDILDYYKKLLQMLPKETKIIDLQDEINPDIDISQMLQIKITAQVFFDKLYFKVPEYLFDNLKKLTQYLPNTEIYNSVLLKIKLIKNQKFPKIYLTQNEAIAIQELLENPSDYNKNIQTICYSYESKKLLKELDKIDFEDTQNEFKLLQNSQVNFYDITTNSLVASAMKYKTHNPKLYAVLWKLLDYLKTVESVSESQKFNLVLG